MRSRASLAVATILVVGLGAYVTAQEQGPVKIAHTTYLTGVAKTTGDESQWGWQLAIKEANDAGGVLGGRKIVGRVYDEGYNAETVVASAKKAIADENVALVGGQDATTCVPLKDVLKEAGVPFAVTTCGTEKPTVEGYPGLVHARGAFNLQMNEYNMISAETRWFMSKYKSLVMVSMDSQYCRNTDVEMRRVVEKEGQGKFKLYDPIYFPYERSETRVEITKAVGLKPDVIYICMWGDPLVVASVKTARQLGFEGPAVLTGYYESTAKQLGPKLSNNVYGSADWAHDPKIPESVRFVEGIKKISGGREPSWITEVSYTATRAVIEAIKKAGTTDRTAISAAMRQAPFTDARGETFGVDAKGQRITRHSVLTQRSSDGRLRIFQKLPLSAATAGK
jgi:branched-chain amino acid transport system substrate-binding protein